MSLRVWLPLNGDLKNIGLSNVRIDSDIFPTIDTQGKIGQCYNFDSSLQQRFRIYDFNPNGWAEFSFTCWAYLRAKPWYIFLTRGSSAHRLRLNSGGFTFRDTNNSALRTLTWGTHEPPLNEWVHLAATYNRGKMCLYLNGSLIGTNDTYYNANSVLLSDMDDTRIGRQQTSTTDDFLDGKLNDIRFYDHCLSAAEVHEISQGLVLHYKLDDITNGIKDSSGYGHNGIANGSLLSDDDSIRYTSAVVFNGNNTYINAGRDAFVRDAITVNIWQYMDTWPETPGRAISCTQGGGWNFEATSGKINFACGTGTTSNTYKSATSPATQTYSSLSSGWHMFTGTYDGFTTKLYVDGQLSGTKAAYTTHTPLFYSTNYLIIGAEASTAANVVTTPYFNGKLSDIRIYCTALSADDILQLYHTSAKIDNKQKLHTFELVENRSKISINKQGQVLCKELTENTNTKFYKTNQAIDTAQIIEF